MPSAGSSTSQIFAGGGKGVPPLYDGIGTAAMFGFVVKSNLQPFPSGSLWFDKASNLIYVADYGAWSAPRPRYYPAHHHPAHLIAARAANHAANRVSVWRLYQILRIRHIVRITVAYLACNQRLLIRLIRDLAV